MNLPNVQDFYPLSPMQQGMLFHSLLSAGSGLYIEQFACTLEGDLDLDAFRRAWGTAMERHTVLRTAFVHSDLKEPVQVVYRKLDVPLRILDWRGLDAESRKSKITGLLDEERHTGFDLPWPPLFRLTVAITAEHKAEFVWTYHHLLLDGWSVPVLLGEVIAAYEAYSRGSVPNLPKTRPYRDYVVWQHRQNPKRAEAFWRAFLKDFQTPTPIAIQRPMTTGTELELESVSRELPPDLHAALVRTGKECRVTLNTMVQAAWALVLSRYSGESDVVFGATVSGRPPELAGAESMVGLFINTLPVRARIEPRQPVSEFLRDVQARQLEAQAFSYTPLLDIQQWSEVHRGTRLFESILVFENYPLKESSENPGGLRLMPIRSSASTNYPLALVATPGAGLGLEILYECNQFSGPAIGRMLGHLESVLAAFAAKPSSALDDVPLLSPREHRELVFERNATARESNRSACIHRLFEEQVERTPDADAVVCGPARWTYRELNRRANGIARALQAQGVGPDVRVALFAERSLELVTAMLGVLKAGGAYVPLDPGYPEERLKFMLGDCGAAVVLAQSALGARLPASGGRVVLIEEASTEGADENVDTPVRPENLAYVIYTSGSTGTPKGALIQHNGACNLILEYIDALGIAPGCRFSQTSSPSFDASVIEIFFTLCGGGSVVVPPPGTVSSSFDVGPWLAAESVTAAFMTPGLLSVLPDEAFPALRVLVAGGEAVAADLVRRWARGRRFFIAYGPTETTVAPSYIELTPEDPLGLTAPIGRPIRNMRLLVLDAQLRPVPVGVPGELHVGGIGVARGYLNRPELTAERFVPDPFGFEPGGRLYRTGDVVRISETGQIEFLSRKDDQLKIRGFRVEPGEIEAALERHPGIQKAVVVAPGGDAGEKRLIAFFVALPGAGVEDTELRAGLERHLPAHMIPAAFVSMDELPLTANGKVDRKAIAARATGAKARPTRFVAPRDYLEEQLARIWQELLNVKAIGIYDDFFALGGHSLLAVRMAGLIRKRLEREVPLLDIVQNPTLEQLAARLREDVSSKGFETLVPLRAGGSRKPFFFAHPSGGSVHWYTDLARLLGPEQPFYGFQARGLTGEIEIDTAIEVMAGRYVAELRTVQPEGPYRLGSWSMGVAVAFEMAHQLRAAGEEVDLLAMFDQGPFPPGLPPADDAEYLVETFGKHIPLALKTLRGMSPVEQLEHTLAKAKAVEFVYPDLSLEQFSLFVRLLRTHIDAWRAYPLRPYPGRVTLFRATGQKHTESEDPDLGWSRLALQGVEIHDVPGDHMTMLQDPHVEVLARELSACLARMDVARGVAV